MKRTLRRTRSLGEATPNAHEVRRTATGALAWMVVSWIQLKYKRVEKVTLSI
jgi:hypothetical protein